MPRFRRKPEVIEAEQWFPDKEIEGVVMRPNYLGGKGHGRIECPPVPYFERDGLKTQLFPGDYITRSEAGFGVARQDYFESMYEPINGDD